MGIETLFEFAYVQPRNRWIMVKSDSLLVQKRRLFQVFLVQSCIEIETGFRGCKIGEAHLMGLGTLPFVPGLIQFILIFVVKGVGWTVGVTVMCPNDISRIVFVKAAIFTIAFGRQKYWPSYPRSLDRFLHPTMHNHCRRPFAESKAKCVTQSLVH